MATYAINEGLPHAQTVEAEYFQTSGDFVDFYVTQGSDHEVVFRMKAGMVQTVKKVS